MQILRDRDVAATSGLRFHHETSWIALVVGIVLLAAVIGVAAVLTLNGVWGSTLAIVGFLLWASVMALPIWLFLRTFRASRRQDSWRLAWAQDRLYLRFRSFQNFGFDPETPSLVAIPRREVRSIRAFTHTLEAQDDEGYWNTRYKIKAIQIDLNAGVDTAPLADALKAEAARRSSKGGRFNHYPVTLSGRSVLRAEIRRPAALLKLLVPYYTVAAEESIPLKRFSDMTRDEKETHILDLVLSGRQIDAIKAAREVYGYDLATAKRLVEGLTQS